MKQEKWFFAVKRGLLDPKHVKAMGEAVWLFLYLVDNADWPTGVAAWTPGDARATLGYSYPTIRKYKAQLETAGYITTREDRNGSRSSTIHNWRNPKERGNDNPIAVPNWPGKGSETAMKGEGNGSETAILVPSLYPDSSDNQTSRSIPPSADFSEGGGVNRSEAVDYILSIAKETSPTGQADFKGKEADQLTAHEQAYGADTLIKVAEECKAEGDGGRGLIKHVLNRLATQSFHRRERRRPWGRNHEPVDHGENW
jgi:hypothetical protein